MKIAEVSVRRPIFTSMLILAFVVFGANHFLKFISMGDPPPEGSPILMFFGAFSSGWMDFIKVLEIAGGILVAIPKTRNFGLLILGPIVINILAFNKVFLKVEPKRLALEEANQQLQDLARGRRNLNGRYSRLGTGWRPCGVEPGRFGNPNSIGLERRARTWESGRRNRSGS